MREQDLEPMIELVLAGAGEGRHPRPIDEPAVREILTGAFEGTRPRPAALEAVA
jgi:hypothetical protein